MAMQWSIDLDRALRSRHPTPLLRPPPWASEPRLFAHTILLRLLATHFTTAHNARILRALLLLRRSMCAGTQAAYHAACPQARALALRMSTRHCLRLAVFRLSVDFSYITLEALPSCFHHILRKHFSLLMSQVGKQIVLGTLEDNFKADMLLSLSRLASKSVLLFGDQLIDDDDFPLDCKRDAFTVLQKIVCGKAPIVHFVDTSELSKLVLAAESSLHSSSWEMQGLIKELARLDDSDCSKVSVANVESFQTYSAREVLGTSNDIKPETASVMASHMGADFDKLKFDPTEFSSKKEVFIVRNIILSTLKFANTCHNMLSKTPGASCNLYDRIKELIECVQQNASQYCSTYEFFHLIMCACISWYACKTRDGNQESGDPTEQPDIFSSPSIWLTQELCAIRITKMLFRKQRYWDAYMSAMYCCREGLWFVVSFVFRKLADDFGSGSFSFWFKSLLLISAGEIEMKLLLFPSAIIKLVSELKTDCDLHESFYCVETNVDSSLAGSSELHGSQAKITDICSKTFLATDHLLSNTSSSHELFFQRWFISLRASFLEILADFLGILTAHLTDQRDESHHDAIGDHSSVPREHNNSQLLALVNCSLRLSELAHSYDLLAVSHGDMDRQSFSSIARLAFMCSLLAFCIAFSVDFSKDSYRLCKFAVAYFLRLRGDTKGIATGEDSVSPLHGGMQFLSSILQRVMELPFVLPKYFFRVRPCFGAELHIYDSNPENRDGISVPSGLQLSLTLCLQWKCVLGVTLISRSYSKLYCVLAASSASCCLDATGTRSKEFEIHKKTAGMVGLNTKLMQYIEDDLRKKREKKRKKVRVEEKEMVTAFARFEASDSGMGFSSYLLDVSEFPQGSYKMKWHACCIDKDGAYYSLLPLNDGAAFSVRKS
ncbi:hypothetical protein OsJ_00029 [Oryza sativa Japonica Group]|uniref:Integrator complex subunit 7-like C-terminal domain-containing protein n=1 Tax=Oryza sativa subsp. japonica TaxID=39947 RepID=B9EYR7_ORYSJ|nr:hypothetical protein OsJ_00029 [Oryza sativa Japonica Group]